MFRPSRSSSGPPRTPEWCSCATRAPIRFTIVQAIKQPTTGHLHSLPRSTVKIQHEVWEQQLTHLNTGKQAQLYHAKKVWQSQLGGKGTRHYQQIIGSHTGRVISYYLHATKEEENQIFTSSIYYTPDTVYIQKNQKIQSGFYIVV